MHSYIILETLADIHFLLDTSGSIGAPGFEKQKQFIAKFAKSFTIGPMQFQIGVSNFGSIVHPQFYMNNYHHLPDLLSAINNVSYDGGGTRTDLALEWAGNHAFTKIAGIREQIDKILIVLTDGESSYKTLTTQQASKLHRKGIKVFAIGIGNTCFNELNCIASDQLYVFTSTDFDSLIDILTDVTDTVKTGKIICKVKKSLKISKGLSESVNRRSTDNTMAKRKRTKGQTTIYKTLHIKLKIE